MSTVAEIWHTIAPYVIPPSAAGIAVIPVFYGFELKSAKQLSLPSPKFSLVSGFKAAPTVGAIFGTQMIAQKAMEKLLMEGKSADFNSILLSSIFVGAVSAPALAVFNGQTIKKRGIESLRALSAKQSGAIITREISFLFSIRISRYASDSMHHCFEPGKHIEYGSTFVTGAIGSFIGHPADTALTLWQKRIKISSINTLLKGAGIKSVTIGSFACLYKGISEFLENIY